jgi:hypothetical protein
MKKTVYIETSIVSYLTARPSDNLLAAACQKITIDWWNTQRDRFELYASEIVLEEAAQGDNQAAQRRLKELEGISLLSITDSAVALSGKFLDEGPLPQKALGDALHIAVSAVHAMDYLLTWNCRHIDNAETKPIIRSICVLKGYNCPEICTPQELMGVISND